MVTGITLFKCTSTIKILNLFNNMETLVSYKQISLLIHSALGKKINLDFLRGQFLSILYCI